MTAPVARVGSIANFPDSASLWKATTLHSTAVILLKFTIWPINNAFSYWTKAWRFNLGYDRLNLLTIDICLKSRIWGIFFKFLFVDIATIKPMNPDHLCSLHYPDQNGHQQDQGYLKTGDQCLIERDRFSRNAGLTY
jgi:hypothetical protein